MRTGAATVGVGPPLPRVLPFRLMTVGQMLRTAWQTTRAGAPIIGDQLLGRLTVERCDARIDTWSRALVRGAGINIRICGKEHMLGQSACVVMSNHQSHYDVPVFFQSYDKPVRMVAKRELFRIPIMGSAMKAAGFIEVDRSRRERAISSLMRARTSLESGVSIWIAPEGTRSVDGSLGAFKKGGFHLALSARARILPVTIDGTRDTLPANQLRVRHGKTSVVTFHRPIDCTEFGDARILELMDEVRAAIAGPLRK